MYTTSASLLERVRQRDDHEAWGQFVRLYTRFLYRCARQCGLEDADATDAVQDVFVLLLDKVGTFEIRAAGSFRGWLKKVTLNKCRERRRKRREIGVGGSDVEHDRTVDDDRLNQFWESEYAEHVVSRALQLMHDEFEPTTWQACWQHIVEGRPAAEVAGNLGLSVSAVYTYSSRVLKRLRHELKDLME